MGRPGRRDGKGVPDTPAPTTRLRSPVLAEARGPGSQLLTVWDSEEAAGFCLMAVGGGVRKCLSTFGRPPRASSKPESHWPWPPLPGLPGRVTVLPQPFLCPPCRPGTAILSPFSGWGQHGESKAPGILQVVWRVGSVGTPLLGEKAS